MRTKGSIWQPDEVQILRNHAQTHTIGEVAAMLGRSYMSVAKRASDHNIRFAKRGGKFQGAKWSDELVVTVLRRFCGGETTTQISADTGIPVNTITNWTSGHQRRHLYELVNGIR